MNFNKIPAKLLLSFLFLQIHVFLGAQQKITNEMIWKEGVFSAASISGFRSMNDGIHYTMLKRNKDFQYIVQYSYETGESVDTLVGTNKLSGTGNEKFIINDYTFSADENQLLIATNTESVYRHSTKSNYFIFNRENQKFFPLSDPGKGKQGLAEFSPDGQKIAFVRNNNLFYVDLNSGTETQVTTDGEKNNIINGSTDWVYEEEFSFDKGFYWSPNSQQIAYYRFDESRVKEFFMPIYDNLYPTEYRFKYPKAGEENAKVDIHIFNLTSGQSRLCNTGSEKDQYIPRIKWTNMADQLCVMRMNRHQNHLEFLNYNTSDRSVILEPTLIYSEKSETYIDINDNLIFLPDNKHFLWNSEKNGFNHIYLYDLNGTEKGAITSGNWDVNDFAGYDPASGKVFFTAAMNSPMEQGVYSTSIKPFLKGSKKESKITPLVQSSGYNTPTFSTGFKYFINKHSDINTPPGFSLYNQSGKKVRDLELNEKLKERLQEYGWNKPEFGQLPTEDGVMLNYYMILPDDFDPEKKYPVLFSVYGGPGSNTVLNAWGGFNAMWYQMLAQEGYIVFSVDPRGTQFRGRDFKHSTYMELGKLETVDMINAAKWIGERDFVDPERLGIFGWSYGGYLTSLSMTKGAEYFSAGIAVAPVTNWRFYDSIYTERFMRTPQENPSGYDDNSPINHVEKLKGSFLLVHGSADDNVHYQNTMEMINALVDANKQFDLFIYPNKNHGIYGGNTRLHLFSKMTTFLKENL